MRYDSILSNDFVWWTSVLISRSYSYDSHIKLSSIDIIRRFKFKPSESKEDLKLIFNLEEFELLTFEEFLDKRDDENWSKEDMADQLLKQKTYLWHPSEIKAFVR